MDARRTPRRHQCRATRDRHLEPRRSRRSRKRPRTMDRERPQNPRKGRCPMKAELTKKAIAANIEALRQLLADAVITASESFQAIQQGEQNQAIGTILDLDRKLEDALALFRAAVALHRTGRAP